LKPTTQANSSSDPFSKYPTQKRAGRVTQLAEHLPNKCEDLNSNSKPQYCKKKKKKERKKEKEKKTKSFIR
jgi:hypothetical protein